MSTAADRVRKHRLSVADYHRMADTGVLAADARTELIDGEIYDMPPIGSRHSGIVNYLTQSFVLATAGRAIVTVQNPIVLGDFSEPEPDLCLLRHRDDFYRDAHPGARDVLLAVEVADTSLRHDREIKPALYARHAVPEVWLIDVPGRRLTVFRDVGAEGYRDESVPDERSALRPLTLPEVVIDLTALF